MFSAFSSSYAKVGIDYRNVETQERRIRIHTPKTVQRNELLKEKERLEPVVSEFHLKKKQKEQEMASLHQEKARIAAKQISYEKELHDLKAQISNVDATIQTEEAVLADENRRVEYFLFNELELHLFFEVEVPFSTPTYLTFSFIRSRTRSRCWTSASGTRRRSRRS